MFEGKHIHFSPVDQKPLCSFSNKLCRQRRLNGFAFCIRHILEDPSAPFKVCSFVAAPGQSKCTNVISVAHPKGLCNTHLQQAGYPVVKRDRKGSKKESGLTLNDSLSTESSKNQSSDHNSSIEMSDGDPYSLSDDTDPMAKNDSINSENCGKTTHMNSPLGVQPLTPSSTSSSIDSSVEVNISKSLPTANSSLHSSHKIKSTKPDLKTKSSNHPKKKKYLTAAANKQTAGIQLPSVVQQLEDEIHAQKTHYLLSNELDESEVEENSQTNDNMSQYLSTVLIRSSLETRRRLLESHEKKEHLRRYCRLAKLIEAEERLQSSRQTSLATKLIEAARGCPDKAGLLLQGRHPLSRPAGVRISTMKIFTKRRCSFKRVSPGHGEPDIVCPELCLPCSTLCSRHILYSVDQQLFEFCSARSSSGPMPCGAPVLAIHSGLPYCPTHIRETERTFSSTPTGPGVNSTIETANNGTNPSGICSSKTARRKARSRSTSSLGRHSRRLRNRRKAKRISTGSETRIHCIDVADNGMELDVETVDSPENCSPAYPTPAQLTPHSLNSAAVPISNSIDHEVEILEEHDLKELLNRLPDEAFQEIFAMTQAATSSSRNGNLFATTREEAEELERALAAEGVPMPIMDKYSSLGVVGNGESDLSDLIDDHTLALAHDIMTMGAGSSAQTMLLGANDTIGSSNHLYMDNLGIPHAAISHPGFPTEAASSSPTFSRRKSLPVIPASSHGSPARGSSPPSLEQHKHDSSFMEDRDSAIVHPIKTPNSQSSNSTTGIVSITMSPTPTYVQDPKQISLQRNLGTPTENR